MLKNLFQSLMWAIAVLFACNCIILAAVLLLMANIVLIRTVFQWGTL